MQSDEEIADDVRPARPIPTLTDLEPEVVGPQRIYVPDLLPVEEHPTLVQSTAKVDFLAKYATVIDLTVESPENPATELSSDDSYESVEAPSTITAIAEALHAMDSRIIMLEEELADREAGLRSLQSMSS